MWPFTRRVPRAPIQLTADAPEDIPDSLGFTGAEIAELRRRASEHTPSKETRSTLPCTCRPKYQPPTFIDPNCYHHREVGA